MNAPRAAILALALALAGCGSLQGDKPVTAQALAPVTAPRVASAAPTAVSAEQARIAAAYGGVYEKPALSSFLNRIAARLSAASERPDLKYEVVMLNSPLINAFALPNGSLYVTRGLLAVANDSSEIAAVLAHEMAHVSLRHANQRADEERKAILVSRVLSDVLQDSQGGQVALAKGKLSLASFSRQQELEADRTGVQTIARAGFDPYGASRFLLSMGRQAEIRSASLGQKPQQPGLDFMSTHPSTPERVQLAVTAARQIGAPGVGERDRDAYLDAIDGVTYGDDPSQGFARGRRFLHPRLGFSFVAPENFVFENGADALLGVAPDGRALRMDATKLGAGQTVESYIADNWVEGAIPGPVEKLDVNGMEAATLVARGRDWTFRFAAIHYGPDVYRLIYAARDLTPDIDQGFRASIMTFRRLNQAESDAARPLKIEVVRADGGQTEVMLASRMAVPDRAADRFAVLNGFASGDKISPNERVKVISE